jgi:signal transduction histidine kinase
VSTEALAEARVVRTIVILLGIAVAIYAALSLATIVDQSRYVNPVWTTSVALVLFGVPTTLAVVSSSVSLRAMRAVLGAYAVLFLLAVALWIPAMRGEPMPLHISPWPLGITSIGTVPAALAWRPQLAWLAVAANGVLLAVVRYVAAGDVDLTEALLDGVFSIAFSSIFTVVAIVAIRNARDLDSAAATARASAAGAASVAARLHEQARLDALVHDELMTALYYATTDRGELTGSVRKQAAKALDELARLDAAKGEEPPVEPGEFASRLRAVLLDLSSGLKISSDLRREAPIPGEVADAFAEGATEALRNSLRHAGGPGVARAATIRVTAQGATVVVHDNGSGFDPAAVDPYRLGLLVSIRGRLNAVDGGSADVSSSPGRGTTVTLGWRDS